MGSDRATVYIDANVFKFSATALFRLFPRTQLVEFADGHVITHDYYEPRYVNPNEKIKDGNLRHEADLLESVATLIKAGWLDAVTHIETHFETWGLRNIDSWTGRFYHAPIESVNGPIRGGRMLLASGRDPTQMQRSYLSKIKHPRFIAIQKITGAYQGLGRYSWNQLMDAFALWCAEYNQCDYFLTLDFKLIRQVKRSGDFMRKPSLVRPSDLLQRIEDGRIDANIQ